MTPTEEFILNAGAALVTLPFGGEFVALARGATAAVQGGATVFKTAHYASRLEAVGLSTARVEAVVESAIAASRSNMAANAAVGGRVIIDGVLVEYRAMLLTSGSVSVGTIFPVLP